MPGQHDQRHHRSSAGCCFFLGIPLGIAAVATGFIGLAQLKDQPADGRGMAIAGIGCGVAALILPFIFLVARVGFAAY